MYKIESADYELVDGEIGGACFKDNVTTDELTVKQIYMIGGNYNLSKIMDDGTSFQVGPIATTVVAVEYINSLIAKELSDAELTIEEIDSVIESAVVDASISPGMAKYTREYLESVADSSGIQGLREIADQYGIRAKSVASIISSLLSVME